ncbi:MAG TPA: cupin domain-containing protein [Methylomirabilota bacterium]|nr:cupin domain-containing protein [Methylomirabilota bacterium]
MTAPARPDGGVTFDLRALDRELRGEEAYLRDGHTARTLVRERDLRIVLVAMRAGARISEHRANATTSVHSLSGHIRLRVADREVDLRPGRVLVLDTGRPHDVEALEESAFLLTLGWS